MVEGDLPIVAAWLREAHVQAWWRDPSAPDHVEQKYLPRIRGEEPTEMFIIIWHAQPVGLIQRYLLRDHPEWRRTLMATGQPFSEAAGIDYAIGEPDLVGRGVGTHVIAEFSREVFLAYPDVDQIVVTPQAANRPSCRVLEKAGYDLIWTGMLDSTDPGDSGPAALYVLQRQAAAS